MDGPSWRDKVDSNVSYNIDENATKAKVTNKERPKSDPSYTKEHYTKMKDQGNSYVKMVITTKHICTVNFYSFWYTYEVMKF